MRVISPFPNILLVLIGLPFFYNVSAQDTALLRELLEQGANYRLKKDTQLMYIDSAILIAKQQVLIPQLAEAYIEKSTFYSNRGSVEELHESLQTVEQFLRSHPTTLKDSMWLHRMKTDYNWAVYYYRYNNYPRATELCLYIIEKYESYRNQHRRAKTILGTAGTMMANILKREGRYQEAIDACWHELRMQETENEENPGDQIMLIYNLLASIYQEINQIQDAKDALHKAKFFIEKDLRLKGNTDNLTSRASTIYNNLAAFHAHFTEYQDSVFYYLQLAEEKANNRPAFLYRIYDTYGFYYEKNADFTLADTFYHKKLQQARIHYREKSSETAETYYNRANIYFTNKQALRALEQVHNGFKSLSANFDTQNIAENPVSEEIKDKKLLFQLLTLKLKILQNLWTEKPQTPYLQAGLATGTQAMRLLDLLRSNYLVKSDKIFLAETAYDVFERVLECCHLLHLRGTDSLNIALESMERSKAALLREELERIQAQMQLNFTPEDLQEYYILKTVISNLELAVNDLLINTNGEKTAEWKAIQDQLHEKRNAFEAFLQKLEQKYPGFNSLQFGEKRFTLPVIQKVLSSDSTLLLNYFTGKTFIYLLAISKKQAKFWRIDKPADFDQKLETLHGIIAKGNWLDNAAGMTYVALASEMYTLLLQKPLQSFPASAHYLVIAPDGKLNYIPFEAFLTQAPSPSELKPPFTNIYPRLPYLLKKYTVSYVFSANLLAKQAELRSTAPHLFVGFAPIYDDEDSDRISLNFRGSKNDLPWAREEVRNIAATVHGKSYLETDATKANFMREAPDHRILHLAMHTLLDHDDPNKSRFLFYRLPTSDIERDNNLYAYELFTMKLRAELAVLSACETGYGKLQQSEGVLSLSYAFAYAGVPAIVMSFWQVHDDTTAPLMEVFYKNMMENDYTKDRALREAKLARLQWSRENQPELAHPYFWANFVAIGHMRPIKF